MVWHLYYTLHGGLFLRARGFCPKHEAMPGREDRLLVAGAIQEHVQSIPMEFRVREWQPRHGLSIQKEMLPSCLHHDVSILPLYRTTASPSFLFPFTVSPPHRPTAPPLHLFTSSPFLLHRLTHLSAGVEKKSFRGMPFPPTASSRASGNRARNASRLETLPLLPLFTSIA